MVTGLSDVDIWRQDWFRFKVSNTGHGMCKTVFN